MNQKVCQAQGGQGEAPRELSVSERIGGHQEVVLGYSLAQAQEAASRCLATTECSYCEVCQLICPDLCITRDSQSNEIRIDLDHCKGCGLCAHFCPKGALSMEPESGG